MVLIYRLTRYEPVINVLALAIILNNGGFSFSVDVPDKTTETRQEY